MSRVRSMRACGPSTGPTACALAGRRCSLWGWRKGVPGGVPSTVVRGAWCQALSLPRLPVLWSGQPGFRDPCVPGAVDAGVWTQHRPHSVRPCGPALLAVGVGGSASPGGGAFHHCEGRLVSGAVPLPTARPLLGGLPGFVGCVRCVWCLCRACRGAWCRSSLGPPVLPSPVSRCGVVLAVCPPCPLTCARPLLVRWLPLVPFTASLLFTLSSALLSGMHFFPTSALLCVSVFFLVGPGFLLCTCVERGEGVNGRAAAAVLSRHGTSSWLVRHATCVCDRRVHRFSVPLAPVLSPHPFGRYLCSLPVPRARRDMQHTCFFSHYLNVS